MKRSMTWIIIAAMAAMLAMSGAAMAQVASQEVRAGVEIKVDAGSALGLVDPPSGTLSFNINFPSAAGQPEVYIPEIDEDRIQRLDIGTLIWSVLLDNGAEHAQIKLSLEGYTAGGGGLDPVNAVRLGVMFGDLVCQSEDDYGNGRTCGAVRGDSVDIGELFTGGLQWPEIVSGIGNSYTGDTSDDGLPLWLEFEVTDWTLLRSGSASGDIVFTLSQQY